MGGNGGGKLECGNQASRIGYSFAGNIKSRSVIRRRPDEWKSEGNVDTFVHRQRLEWDQRLVVVETKRHVIAAAGPRREHRVRRQRPEGVNTLRP